MISYRVNGLTATPLLRWVMRAGQKVLEQAFTEPTPDDSVRQLIWREVETRIEDSDQTVAPPPGKSESG